MKRSILFAFFLGFLLTASGMNSPVQNKVVINGKFVKSDSCHTFLQKLPPGVTLNMKDPCGIECTWFDVRDRDNEKNLVINPDRDGNFQFEIPVKGLSIATINSVYHGRLFFLYPGDTVSISINDTNRVAPVLLRHKNDTVQEYYLRNLKGIWSMAGFPRWRHPLNDSLLIESQEYADSCANPYKELLQKNLCSEEFFDFATTEIRYYTAYQVSSTLAYMYENDTLSASEKNTIIGLLDKVYLRTPLYCDTYITPDGTGYHDYIINWIWLQYLKSGKYESRYKGNPALIHEKLAMVKKELTPKAYEIFTLDFINTYAQYMDTVALSAFRQFMQEFPSAGSDYEERYNNTKKHIDRLQDFLDASSEVAEKEIVFMEGDSIHSLDDLIRHFPGKTVYVDIWATWCGPCIMLFKYNDTIRPFLKEHDITEIFLSLDKNKNKWETAVKYYKLKGVNIRASGNLITDLKKQLSWNGGVPRFFIINREGRLTVKDAFQPVSKGKLFDQLLEN